VFTFDAADHTSSRDDLPSAQRLQARSSTLKISFAPYIILYGEHALGDVVRNSSRSTIAIALARQSLCRVGGRNFLLDAWQQQMLRFRTN
jgi:hypothetical protein